MRSIPGMRISDEVLKAAEKGLSYELLRVLSKVYGKRGEKAFFYVKRGKVRRYRDFFVVKGREEYVVDDDFCTCKDFQIRLRCERPCAHIIAVAVAKKSGIYERVDRYYVDELLEKT